MKDITLLREALPYIQRFRGRIFVVKVGGEAIENTSALENLVEDLSLLHSVGIRVVLVHGGNPQINAMSKALGVEIKKVGGRRITDVKSLEIIKMTLGGSVNLDIVAKLKRLGVPAVGIAGISGDLIQAKRRPPKAMAGTEGQVVDFGLVGDITGVDVSVLNLLLDNGKLPVVAPMGCDEDGQILNINGDVAASHMAVALKAERLLLMTSTLGVLTDPKDPSTVIGSMSTEEAEEAIRTGIITEGMIPKVQEALNAVRRGLPSATILSAIEPHQLMLEIFTDTGCGTMLEP